VGLALIVVWVGALQIMLDKGNELDWFDSGFIDALAVVAALGLATFVVWELTEAHPIVDLRLFKLRNFTAGTLSVSLGFGVFFGNVVLLPLWLQTQMSYTSTWAGLVVAPYGILAFLLSPAVGKNLNRIDPRLFATAAFLIFAVASFWRAGFTPDASFGALALPQLLQGAGIAMYFTPLMAISLGGLQPERMAFASGLANFFRTTAGSFGASLVTTFWQRREALHRTQLVESITSYSPHATSAVTQLQHAGLTDSQSMGQISAAITHQSTLLAATDLFWLSGWLFLLLMMSVWLARRPSGGAPVGAH
jgi:MFS transporter, DHA2 family, multidrug resistance protein